MVGLVLDGLSKSCASKRRTHPQLFPHCCAQVLHTPTAFFDDDVASPPSGEAADTDTDAGAAALNLDDK